MAFTLLQVGATLVPLNQDGVAGSALTLPAGITLNPLLVPRFARINRYLVLVDTPTRPVSIDESGIVRPLTLNAPLTAPVLTVGAAGALSGVYLVKQTYVIKDISGNTISESDYGPTSNELTVAAQKIHAAFPASSEAGATTRLYRTTTGPGGVFFKWADVVGTSTILYEDDLADAGLGIVAGPVLGPASDLTLIVEWQGRLWGVDRLDVDHLRFTEAGTMFAWNALNTIPIPHVGDDAAGINGLVPRRNALGVGRQRSFAQITGTSLSNFQVVTVTGGEQASFVSQESCVVRNDVAIFLGSDGVYKWDSSGITSLTDGKVRSWFATDDYFNRALFFRAFAQLDRASLKYRLFLTSVGNTIPDRWVEMDLLTGAWFGPHRTNAFSLSCAVDVITSTGLISGMVGSREGYVSRSQETRNDWLTTPISVRVKSIAHSMGEPDLEKYWGELSVNGKQQASGGMNVLPFVGDLGVAAQPGLAYDMTAGRERLPRMGVGKHLSLEFDHATLNEEVMLYGYEVNPVSIIGRR